MIAFSRQKKAKQHQCQFLPLCWQIPLKMPAYSVLVGNKCDLKEQRQVEYATGEKQGKRRCVAHCRVSVAKLPATEFLFLALSQLPRGKERFTRDRKSVV